MTLQELSALAIASENAGEAYETAHTAMVAAWTQYLEAKETFVAARQMFSFGMPVISERTPPWQQ